MKQLTLLAVILLAVNPAISQHDNRPSGRVGAPKIKTRKSIRPGRAWTPDERLYTDDDYAYFLATRGGWRLAAVSLTTPEGKQTRAYYDPLKIERLPHAQARVWTQYQNGQNDHLRGYFTNREEYSCKTRRFQTIESSEFDAVGNFISNRSGDHQWKLIVPNSLQDRLYSIICLDELDEEDTAFVFAAYWFANGRQLEKQGRLQQANRSYGYALKYAPDNEKILAAINRTTWS